MKDDYFDEDVIIKSFLMQFFSDLQITADDISFSVLVGGIETY